MANLEQLLERTQSRLQAAEEQNEVNLDLTCAKLQVTVKAAKGLNQNQLNLAKTLVKFYNAVHSMTSAKPASMQKYNRI